MLLTVCGIVSLRSKGGAEITLRRHGAALLAYLALTPGHKAPRPALAAMLWPMRAPAQARGSLRQCLSELRASHADIADLIDASASTISLRKELLATDLDQVEEAPSADDLRRLLPDLASTTLVGIDIHGEFERWIGTARRSIEVRLRTAVHARLGELRNGDAQALAALWCARVPGDEVARAALAAPQIRFTPPAATPAPDVHAPPLLIVAGFDVYDERHWRLARALRDEILLHLGRFRELRLVDDQRRADEIMAQPAPPGFLLSATIIDRDGAEAIRCRMVATSDRQVVWSDEFGLSTAEMRDSVRAVTGQVTGKLMLDGSVDPRRVQEASGELYARFIATKAASLWPASYTDARAGAAFLRLIHTEAPAFAPAYIAHARLIATDYGFTRGGPADPAEQEEARNLARAALALDNGQPNCWTLVGWSLLRQGEWAAAQQHFEQALRLNPHHAARLNEIATGFLLLGEQAQADELLERSRALMLAPDNIYWSDRGLFALVRRDAAAACDALVSCAQPLTTTWIYRVLALTLAGRDAAAARAQAEDRLRAIWPGGEVAIQPLTDWFDRHHPFRRDTDKAFFRDLLTASFA